MSNKFFDYVSSRCKQLSSKREVELLEEKIISLKEKQNMLLNKTMSSNVASKEVNIAKSKVNVTCNKEELIINVVANVQVKDVCRNIERKIQRNLRRSNNDDKQLLFNHLYYFYSLKHVNTLPIIHGKNKDYNIVDYVAMRVNSVMNDVTCHINFDKK